MIDIDIGKRYPGYFNQWIFRPLVVCMIGLFVLALWSNGWKWSGSYVECPPGPDCQVRNPSCPVLDCDPHSPLCVDNCPALWMDGGTFVGDKPSWLADNAGFLEYCLVVCAFLINHLLWLAKKEAKA